MALSDQSPSSDTKHNDRDSTAGQILLILKVAVGRDEYVVAVSFGSVQEFSVAELVPAVRPSLDNDMIFAGISVDPVVRSGKLCITGTRMDVATVVGLFTAGETIETVSSQYELSIEQIRAALAYAAHVAAHLPPAVRQAS